MSAGNKNQTPYSSHPTGRRTKMARNLLNDLVCPECKVGIFLSVDGDAELVEYTCGHTMAIPEEYLERDDEVKLS